MSGWRWLLGAWGVGTYRQDDSVDVRWTSADGTPRLSEAEDLPDPAEDAHVGAAPSLEDVVAAVGARVSPEGWEAEAEDLINGPSSFGQGLAVHH